MVCLSPVGYGVWLTFRALALRWSRLNAIQHNALYIALILYSSKALYNGIKVQ